MWPLVPEVVELLERYHAFHAGQGNDLQVGLRLPDLLREAGWRCWSTAGSSSP